MTGASPIKNVAIIGIGGNLGKAFVEELLKTGKHEVTALLRPESQAKVPEGIKTKQVAYDDEDALAKALEGQQFFIITLSVRAPQDLHGKIVKAAAKAKVPYVMPNNYGYDINNKSLISDPFYGPMVEARLKDLTDNGVNYVNLVCGFWYEWSLALGDQWYGIDLRKKSVTFYDDGNTKINTSTWDQCGRALAALLSLPENGSTPSLSQWKNQAFYMSSFKVSQREMLDSVHRVIGTSDSDWSISYQKSDERFKEGLQEMQNGVMTGFAKALYARLFYPDGSGDYESNNELSNGVLGLPKEDLDEATKRAVEMVQGGWNPFPGMI